MILKAPYLCHAGIILSLLVLWHVWGEAWKPCPVIKYLSRTGEQSVQWDKKTQSLVGRAGLSVLF